jgi:hypothetical protein
MDHKEYMRRMREITAAWSKRYSERIPNEYPAGSDPHEGVAPEESDYAQFHAQHAAAPEFMDILEEKLAALDREWAQSPEAQGAGHGRS